MAQKKQLVPGANHQSNIQKGTQKPSENKRNRYVNEYSVSEWW
jgi:hypothetical protein